MEILYEVYFPPTIIKTEKDLKISIFMETHKTSPEKQKDPLTFKNLLTKVEASLKERGVLDRFSDTLTTLKELQEDTPFWSYNDKGLGILATEDEIEVYRLNRVVEDHASVGSLFYIKPLLRHFQSTDMYYLLGLTKTDFVVYQGNRYGFGRLDFGDLETTRTALVGGPDEINSGYDASNRNHESTRDETRDDVNNYFLQIHKFIDKHLKITDKSPLILMGVTEMQGLFRAMDKNDHILEQGLTSSLDSIESNGKALQDQVWKILEPYFNEKTETLLDRYHARFNDEMSSSDLASIIRELVNGRVSTLVLESDRTIVNDYKELSDYDPGDDTLSIMADIALRKGVDVVVLPNNKMPNDSGAFALYRY